MELRYPPIELQIPMSIAASHINPPPLIYSSDMVDSLTMQRQTAVTAYLKSKQLLLFVFTRR